MSFRDLSKGQTDANHHAIAERALGRRHGAPAGSVLRGWNPLGEFPLMKPDTAVAALGALAQEHRLALFRLLVQAGETGMPAGAIAEALGVPNSSLSFHLAQLRTAGLILQERQHRSLIYRANYQAMNGLIAFLTENCCGGAVCAPAAACEAPAQTRKSA
jgi:DNA-binding transcriptional ArsR family regulator